MSIYGFEVEIMKKEILEVVRTWDYYEFRTAQILDALHSVGTELAAQPVPDYRPLVQALRNLLRSEDGTPGDKERAPTTGTITPKPVVTTTEYEGGCPECGKNSGMLNVERTHYCVCETHEVYWCVGGNLYSGWRRESEATWHKNAALLDTYREVEPIFPEREPECPRCGERGSHHNFCRYSDGTLTPLSDEVVREMVRHESSSSTTGVFERVLDGDEVTW